MVPPASPSPAAPLLRVESLWVRFGAVLALKNVSLEVYPGEAATLVGANGSGKTTLLRVIAGLERPAIGGASVGPHDSWRERTAVWGAVELLTPDERLPAALDALDCMRLFSPDAPREEIEARARRIFAPDALDLAEPHRRVRLENLSVGMRQKVALATIGAKPALLLDEPTEGLDPVVCHRFRAEARRGGRTVLTVSHDLAEAEAAERVLVLREGTLKGFGPPDLLRRWLGAPDLAAVYDRLTRGDRGPLRVALARVRVSEAVAPGTARVEGFEGFRGDAPPEGGELLAGRALVRRTGGGGAAADGTGRGPAVVLNPADAAPLALEGDPTPRRAICWPVIE